MNATEVELALIRFVARAWPREYLDQERVEEFEALYQDIVPDERIVYTYEMHLDEPRISVSLSTVELRPDGPRSPEACTSTAGMPR